MFASTPEKIAGHGPIRGTDHITKPFTNSLPEVRAPRGTTLGCAGWQQEAVLRMLMNSLDPEVAGRPPNLAVYGGSPKPVCDGEFETIVAALKRLQNNQTLFVQSGKLTGVLTTSEAAPRVFIVNASARAHRTTWEPFSETDRLGLAIFRQMTAGSWIHTGTQGILQGTYEVFAAAAQRHLGGEFAGKFVVSGGMGGMGGAQSLAATLNGAAFLGIEVNPERIKQCIRAGYCDICVNSLDEAIRILKNAVRKKQGVSVGLAGNCAEIVPELARRGIVPDLLTDQTGANDPLNGYVAAGLAVDAAAELRRTAPDDYRKRSYESIARQVAAMLELQKLGSVAFEFGNNLRKIALEHGGVKDAYQIPDFFPAYLRPLLKASRAPVRWAALSGEASDIYRIDDLVLELFPEDGVETRWIRQARRFVKFQGLPARVCWLGKAEFAEFRVRVNDLMAKGELKAPIVIARDRASDEGDADEGDKAKGHTTTPGKLLDSKDLLWLHGIGENATDATGSPSVSSEVMRGLESFSGASWVSVDASDGPDAGGAPSVGIVFTADGRGSGGGSRDSKFKVQE